MNESNSGMKDAMPTANETARRIEEEVLQKIGAKKKKRPPSPFRAAIFRGLAVVLPPLLTIVIFLWAGGIVNNYIIQPIFSGAKYITILATADIVSEKKAGTRARTFEMKGITYKRSGDGTYVPETIYSLVEEEASANMVQMPQTGFGIYEQYIEKTFLNPYIFIPVLTLVFILLLYLVGNFIAASAGRFLWRVVERLIERLPLVRDVYGAVKQVSDFVLTEHEMHFSRVVAVEWPRKGIWALALVTSEGLPALEKAIGEPLYGVLIPTSPMPATGFTLHVKRSETLDVGITIDQAVQFVVSCGVVALGPADVSAVIPAPQDPPLETDKPSS